MRLLTNIPVIRNISNIYSLISKRVKFGFITGINAILLAIYVLFFSDGFNLLIAFIFSLVSIFLFGLVLVFGITRHNFAKSLPVPTIFIFSSFVVLHFFPNLNIYFKLAFAMFSASVYYFLLLSLNVFYVVEEKGSSIPLLRPAKTTFLLIEVTSLFLYFTVLYKFILPDPFTEVTFIVQSGIVLAVSFLFAMEYWWSQNMEQEITSFVGNESLTIAFIVCAVSLSLSFMSTEAFFRAMALIVTYYVCLSFFQSVVTHKLQKGQYLEYVFLALIVVLFLALG